MNFYVSRKCRQIVLGPLLLLTTAVLLQDYFGFKAACALGTALWMGWWWIARPVSISVTALVPIVVNALFSLIPMPQIISQYFSEIIVLLFGSDLVCLTWETTHLDKRLAIKTLCCIGTSLRQQIMVWLLASTVLSIFLPNAVVCTIMVPVAVSMLHFLGEKVIAQSKIAVPILLAIVWGAGIGGFGSPLGGAANLVAINYLEKFSGKEFMYVDWVVRFVPILILVVMLNLFFLYRIPVPVSNLAGSKEYFSKMYRELGAMRYGEKVSFILFFIAMLLSFIRPVFASYLPGLKPAYIFLVAAFLCFLLYDGEGKPLLTWEYAEKHVMWGMLYLFAGGLALGALVTQTGAAQKMAELITRLPLSGGIETVFVFTLFSTVLTEISSNTAAAAIAVPVVQSIAQALALNPIPYLFISIVAFNCAYVLPVSIRAIAVSYGLDSAELFRNGLMLTLSNVVLVTVVGYLMLRFWPLFNVM